MSLIGGTLTGPLVFILPPLFYLKMKSLEKQHHTILASESFQNIVFSSNSENDITKYIQERFRYDFRPSISFMEKCERSVFKEHSERLLCTIIMVGSIILTLGTTYTNFTNVLFSHNNLTASCIYNISRELIYL